MEINKLLTTVNYRKGESTSRIKYIVVHYVGSEGTAEANCRYFEKYYRAASAHYFVGHEGEVWQSVEDKNIAWHCGSANKINNNNSLGVEMCCYKGKNWYFTDATISSTIGLVRELMEKYQVPVENVVRHYEVTKKKCPEPYVREPKAWNAFKMALGAEEVKLKPVEEVAKEVINGRWGNGSERKKKLAAAGYDYAEVQSKVNEILLGKKVETAPAKKSIDEVAREVINGRWGNGSKRKKALEAAGYNYREVQDRVNAILKGK